MVCRALAWRAPVSRACPSAFATTRSSLHALAEHVLTPSRQRTNGKIGLRYTHRGFGTPFFGADAQVRIEGRDVVLQRGDTQDRSPISTVAAAAAFVGIQPGAPEGVYQASTALEPDRELEVEGEASLCLGAWFGFATSVLEELRWDLRTAEPSRVQLWPEHFDLSVELGDEAAGSRAGYGASPGDEAHPLPYLYVAPWDPEARGDVWNDPNFHGASLGYGELLDSADQRGAALSFLRRCFEHLNSNDQRGP